ncbi:MAG: GDYXXLXY domain-containing protein [Okeania sp. SIO2G4]|uniref:GDYXXLXY domain-containing protein n=1 Tax=unclassified Okeania TaxID=2634635 RepID=UPI0013B7A24C|nr:MULTISPECIES: GDYXXLXY domain-containing protein [unclassified Okeania]NEP73674.1 GDYXXLXY domain-containing protein [Okeania sp. SIO2G5]NEP94376.1 GDYXXLXY domain-containing protein [Okeania sp. SIO2F5]NEQ92234.1 GDYXXLXY domain-containing protein [Okeania sp. SIO2G4]
MKFINPFNQSNLSTKESDYSEELNPPINQTKSSKNQMPIWRFILSLTVQLALILSIPAQAIYTTITGRTVVLQTVPVDPYDFLRGYYQVLSYDISRKDNLSQLPGWNKFELESSGKFSEQNPTDIYVILVAPETTEKLGIPKAWKPVDVSAKQPQNWPDNQIAIQGKFNGSTVQYGLETYYMPEDKREGINQNIREAQTTANSEGKIPFVVEVKVSSQGQAVPVSLWVRDRNYKF